LAIKLDTEELELQLAAAEWRQQQEYYMRHPELKKNNFFMRSVGAGLLQKADSVSFEPSEMHREIREIEARAKQYEEATRKEHAQQRLLRRRRDDEEFHRACFSHTTLHCAEEL
jgi:hypothetical protein